MYAGVFPAAAFISFAVFGGLLAGPLVSWVFLLITGDGPRQRGPDYHDIPALIPKKGSLPDPPIIKKAEQICSTFFDRFCVYYTAAGNGIALKEQYS